MTTISADTEEGQAAAGPGFGWRLVSIAGELIMTVGVLLLLLVVYELWWTNVQTGRAVEAQREELANVWSEGVNSAETPPIPAEAFGLMYIPRLRSDVWGYPLIEGISDTDLANGIGHFPDSVLPGETGNTAFAGHRATHGEPLKAIDELRAGDMVYIETGLGWYSYRLEKDQIVLPTDVWVVDPVPGSPRTTQPTEELITLITCNPRWGSTQRWVWWGELTDVRSRLQGPPDELAAELKGA